jgi:hypothetical protein
MAKWTRLALALALGLVSFRAAAQPVSDQDRALAATLFDDGRTLMTQGNVPDACRKLEESRRLDPLPGTVLNLARCHELEGLTASAMVEFREARAMAERDQRGDRVAFADEHLKALMPRLSMLVIVVPSEVDSPSLVVQRDGIAIGRAAWGTRIPVDPGAHVVEASAPGKTLRRLEVKVGPEGDVQTVTLSPLDDAPTSALATPALPPTPAPATTAPGPVSAAPDAPAARQAGLSARRTWAIASLGAGVVGIATGTVSGAVAIGKHNAPGATCTASPCSSTSVGLNNDAKTFADVSTVTFIVGAVGVGLGAFLWFGDSVTVAPGVGSFEFSGRF